MSDINKSMQSSRYLPHGTPESEFSNFECYQNYTAPEVFVQHIAGIVNQGDVQTIVRAQKQMLQRFEKTNEMLLNCNALSSGRLKAANDDFRKHIKLISEMKKDLDYIFRKVRNIKARIGVQYPQAAMKAEQKVKANSLCEDGQELDGDCAMAVDAAQIANASSTATHSRSSKSTAKSSNERRSSRDAVTVDYIQMDRKVDVEPGIAANDTDNESSDTSDT